MAKQELPYKVKNNLDKYIVREVGRKTLEKGTNYTKKKIMEEVAEYCEVSFVNIKRISVNSSQPSLAVAIKIANYFDTRVENIFEID